MKRDVIQGRVAMKQMESGCQLDIFDGQVFASVAGPRSHVLRRINATHVWEQ